ncbi:hypothetical protein ONZ45_g7958 [Pleurotus djamor]|nr:hypothetical protein ONZ45_g7958 [Pleurotus djamor]
MVNSKAIIITATLSATALAVPLNGNADSSSDVEFLEAREPMLPPPGGFKFDWNNRFHRPILAGIAREEDQEIESREPIMMQPDKPFNWHPDPNSPLRFLKWGREIHNEDNRNIKTRDFFHPSGVPSLLGERLKKKLNMRERDHEDIEAREPMIPRPFNIDTDIWNGKNNRVTEDKERTLPIVNKPSVRKMMIAREPRPRLPIPGVDAPPVGWMSPWWKGKPVGESIKFPKLDSQKRAELEDIEIEAREPIMPPPPGHESHHRHWRMRIPIGIPGMPRPGPGPVVARDFDSDELEVREPVIFKDRVLPPSGWKSPWFHGRPVGAPIKMARDDSLEELD